MEVSPEFRGKPPFTITRYLSVPFAAAALLGLLALERVYITYKRMPGVVSWLHQFFCFCLQAGIQALHKQTFRVKLHRRDRGRNPDRG